MNKKELVEYVNKEIEVIEKQLEGFEGEIFSGNLRGNLFIYEDLLDKIERLDEPEKYIVPKCFDEWYQSLEDYYHINRKSVACALIGRVGWGFCLTNNLDVRTGQDEYHSAQKWVVDNGELYAINAVINGYEVETEKEQLYYVKLPQIGYMRFDKKYLYSTIKENAKKYTENEIKEIDPRYWVFAVKVED